MSRYAGDSRDRVKDAVDIVDLISKRTELRRAGADSHLGLCPFHDERTPSFNVSPAKKLYHCFGCGESGDAFDFVMHTEGLDFVGALETLAERYGVQLVLEDEDPHAAERRKQRERLLDVLSLAADYYARYLWESDEATEARAYLERRGLEREVLETFRVGYAPSAWDRVLNGSQLRGYSKRELYDAGLVQRSQSSGRLYDRFRARITFPLCDRRGRVLGFGARALSADRGPKYVNSNDTAVYHKGHHVFGADQARVAAARAASVIVVEGYTDVLALHQAGLANSVGLMGTALTSEQMGELAQLAPQVALALDADGAGREAMLRVAQLAAGRRVELRVVAMPSGADPADVVSSDGPKRMQELVEASVPFVRFQIEQVLASENLESSEGKDRALTQLRPVIGKLPTSVLREELVRIVADRLDLSPKLVETLLDEPGGSTRATSEDTPPTRQPATRSARRAVPLGQNEHAERTFLAICVALPDAGRDALRSVDLERHFTSSLVRRAAEHLRAHLAAPLDGLPSDEPELTALIGEIAIRAEREPLTRETLDAQLLDLEVRRLEREIAAASAQGSIDVSSLAAQRTELKHRFHQAMDRAVSAASDERR